MSLWGQLAELLAVIQWFIVLFTGQRNDGIWNMQRAYLDYAARVQGYVWLLHDEFPPFGTESGRVPVVFDFDPQPDPPNRLTNALRLICPVLLLAAVIGIGAYVGAVISWFAIVITGRHPRGMWEFVLKFLRFYLEVTAYTLLMTDTYPSFGRSTASMASPASTPGSPLPPPPGPPPPGPR